MANKEGLLKRFLRFEGVLPSLEEEERKRLELEKLKQESTPQFSIADLIGREEVEEKVPTGFSLQELMDESVAGMERQKREFPNISAEQAQGAGRAIPLLRPSLTASQFREAAQAQALLGKPELEALKALLKIGIEKAKPQKLQKQEKTPEQKAAEVGAVESEKRRLKLEAEKPKAEERLTFITSDIDDTVSLAKRIIANPALRSATGFKGVALRNIPQREEFNVAKDLETLKVKIGFDKLQKMRQMSPTGGALGQVSEKESVFLQNSVENLDPKQSFEKVAESLKNIINTFEKERSLHVGAFEKVYGKFSGGTPPQSSNSKGEQRVRVIAPDGQEGDIPLSQLRSAISKGFKVK